MLFLFNSQPFSFNNKGMGVRCWDKTLLTQRGRKSTQLTFILFWYLRLRSFFDITNKSPIQWPSLLLPVHLSVHPSHSLLPSMFFFFYFILCQLHAWFTSWPMGYLILFTIFNQRALRLKVYGRAGLYHN